jgi:acetolactate synthase-1/2/3 large subunit
MSDWHDWRRYIADLQYRYPVTPNQLWIEKSVNPYVLMETISDSAPDNAAFFIDTGCAISWSMQALRLKPGQNTFHDFNNTAMGWALPAAMGGALALPDRPIICIVGDGSMMMNLQELATIKRYNLPIKIILLDNGGYSMVRQTEDQWLQGVNVGTSIESGLGFPNFLELAYAFGITAMEADTNAMLPKMLKIAFSEKGPFLLRVEIPHEKRVEPKVAFGFPIEDGAPYLPREEFLGNMMVKPMGVSVEKGDS